MATLRKTLVLTGHYAGKSVRLSTGKLSAITVEFENGVAHIQGTEKDVEGLTRYMGRCYQAHPEGSLELIAARKRDKDNGSSGVQTSTEQGQAGQVSTNVRQTGEQTTQISNPNSEATNESKQGSEGSVSSGNGHENPRFPDTEEGKHQESLYQGVMALDPINDDHWTAQGLPRIDVLEEISGPYATRKNIDNVCPEYTREAAFDLKANAEKEKK